MYMKKKRLLLGLVLLFVAVIGYMACSNNNEVSEDIDSSMLYDFYDSKISSAIERFSSIDNLPKWIQNLVAEPEKHRDERVPGLEGYGMRIYQCNWKNNVYYFIWEVGKSCIYCDALYHVDGTLVNWQSIEEIHQFKSECSAWVCIYSF